MTERGEEPSPRPRRVAAVAAWMSLLVFVGVALAPFLGDWATFGFHDWDVQTSHRHLVNESLLRHHEFPYWNPYACGGFPAWGYVEGGTTVVSPFLPAYLWLPMAVALRIEVLGMALIGAAGAYACAARFTTSHAARLLVAALWAVNGRWGLQTASGHTWHLAYAWMPWALFFFERARQAPHRPLPVALCGATFAMLVYSGGIYPLPHTILALFLYSVVLAISERSARPLLVLAVSGLVGVGLSAPRLLPLLDGFGKAPRLVDSTEWLRLDALWVLLTSRDQAFHSRPAPVSPYGWHEWGMYISFAGVVLVGSGVFLLRGAKELGLAVAGLALGVLGIGAFHPLAPWTLLHDHVPVFRSQHAPSRFLYPAVLMLTLCAAAGFGRLVEERARRRPFLDAVLVAFVLAIGVDVALVAQKPLSEAMWMVPPGDIPPDRPFHFEDDPPYSYVVSDWAGPMYLAMLGNTGVLHCYGAPPFDRKGALSVSDPRYRGEAYVQEEGTASVVAWSPNRAVVEVEGAPAGALLVYNMNYDEGFRSSAGPVVNHEDRVAVRLPPGTTRVTFQYTAPGAHAGLVLALVTLTALAIALRRDRRLRRDAT